MPARNGVDVRTIAGWPTLTTAAWRAARGRRSRPAVRTFLGDFDRRLRGLQARILEGHAPAPAAAWTAFEIRDPKPRRIVAPCFDDRVLHHALMTHLGPGFVRALIADTYACVEGRGGLRAVHRAQQHLRRWPWVVQTDVRAYFASIDHDRLFTEVIQRRVKHPKVQALLWRILQRWPNPERGRGLPIGALTSQYFANSYLDAVDRYLTEHLRVAGYVRYMDDLVWWCRSKAEARATFESARIFVERRRRLHLKAPRMARSADGITFVGYRVTPGALRLTRRRKCRYRQARSRWEAQYQRGEISADALQRGYASALAITRHADAAGWRREQLRRVPTVDA